MSSQIGEVDIATVDSQQQKKNPPESNIDAGVSSGPDGSETKAANTSDDPRVSFERFPPEVMDMILEKLCVSDLLWARLVNKHFFHAVAAFSAPKIVYNFAIGASADPSSIRMLLQSQFPYQHFRITADEENDRHALPAGVDEPAAGVVSSCSSAVSFQFLEGSVESPCSRSMIRSAAGSLKSLWIGECYWDDLADIFKPTPADGPAVHFEQLEKLVFVESHVTDALLATVLPCTPKLRALTLRLCARGMKSNRKLVAQNRMDKSSTSDSPSSQFVTAQVLIDLLRKFCPHIESLDVRRSGKVDHLDFVEELTDAAASEPKLQFKVLCIDSYCLADGQNVTDNIQLVQKLSKIARCLTSQGTGCRVQFVGDPDFCQPTGQEISWLCRREDRPSTRDGIISLLRERGQIKCLHMHQVREETWRLHVSLFQSPAFLSDLNLSHLTSLALDHLAVWSPEQWNGAISVIAASCSQVLTSLSLEGNAGVTDDVMPGLLGGLPKLRMLSLAECNVSDKGLARIPRGDLDQKPTLSDLKHLVALDVSLTHISDVTLEHGLDNPSLEFLSLTWCSVTDKGLRALNDNAKNLLCLVGYFCSGFTATGAQDFVRNSRRLTRLDVDVAVSGLLPSPRPRKYEEGVRTRHFW